MSTRTALTTRLRYNLDDTDSTNYRWTAERLEYLLEEARREVFTLMEGLSPGRYTKTSETLAVVSGTREYVLAAGTSAIGGVEWIAENGTALSKPVPVERIEYEERYDHDIEGTIHRGAHFYYTYVALASGIPKLYIGFVPTPATTGADIKVYEYVEPWEQTANAWTPGDAAKDTYPSGIPSRWEDYLVTLVTIAALAQRPPQPGSKTFDHYKDKAQSQLQKLLTREQNQIEQEVPRSVHWDETEGV